eukprot:scaffold82911_cov17-Tisochrysis_lutea.AAC.1
MGAGQFPKRVKKVRVRQAVLEQQKSLNVAPDCAVPHQPFQSIHPTCLVLILPYPRRTQLFSREEIGKGRKGKERNE